MSDYVKFPTKSDNTTDWAAIIGVGLIALAVLVAAKHANKIPVVGSALAKIV